MDIYNPAIAFCAGWICCISFVWFLLNFFDKEGKHYSLLVPLAHKKTEPSFVQDDAFNRLTELVQENQRLLQSLIQPSKSQQFKEIILPEPIAPELEEVPVPLQIEEVPFEEVVGKGKGKSKEVVPKKPRETPESIYRTASLKLIEMSEDLPVVKEGHLYIKTGKLWQRRLLKLTSGCLRVYKSGSAAELHDLLATVVLHQSSVTPTIGTKNAVTISQQNGLSFFQITKHADDDFKQFHSHNGSNCILRSKDGAEMEEWAQAIQNAAKECEDMLAKYVARVKKEPAHELAGEVEEEEFLDEDEEEEQLLSAGELAARSSPSLLKEKQPAAPPEPAPSRENVLQCADSPAEQKGLHAMLELLRSNNELDDEWLQSIYDGYGKLKKGTFKDGRTLRRFLRARQCDPQRAYDMLKAYMVWRNDFRPHEITLNTIQSEVIKHKAYFHCYDKKRHPIMICSIAKHNPKDSDCATMLKLIVYLLETSTRVMEPPQEKFATIFDCTGFSVNQMDWPVVKEGINILQNFFPERLGALYVINYPWVVNMLWSVIKPWLDNRTSSKVHFLSTQAKLLEHIDAASLPVHLGGRSLYRLEGVSMGEETLQPGFVPLLKD